MTRDEYLLELQKLIAKEKGYTRLEMAPITGQLCGWAHPDEDSTFVPRWPWDWCDSGALVAEMDAHSVAGGGWCEWSNLWEGHPLGQHRFVFHNGTSKRWEAGHTFEEAASRCWLRWKGVDLTHLPSVAP